MSRGALFLSIAAIVGCTANLGDDEPDVLSQELGEPGHRAPKTTVFAWAWGADPATGARLSVEQTASALDTMHGLGAVLYPHQYELAARRPGEFLAYVGNMDQAKRLADVLDDGGRLVAAIFKDECNESMYCGGGLTPSEYRARLEPVASFLRSRGIPVATNGIAPSHGRFDDTWFDALVGPDGGRVDVDYYAFNPNQVRRRELRRVLDKYESHGRKWLLSPAPFRRWWERTFNTPVSEQQWLSSAILGDSRVRAVSFWSLVEGKGQIGYHGLLDRRGRPTVVGRNVLERLPCPDCSDEYGRAGHVPYVGFCPDRMSITGFRVRAGGAIDSLQPVCSALDRDGDRYLPDGDRVVGTRQGGNGGNRRDWRCPEGTVVVGGQARIGNNHWAGRRSVRKVRFRCAELVVDGGRTRHENGRWGPWIGALAGSNGRAAEAFVCPAGRSMKGFSGRHNATALGRIRFECGDRR